ncbi:hypothetical protein HZB89_01375, partial [archaeon]|nr:hypothetical protein [archaeon]
MVLFSAGTAFAAAPTALMVSPNAYTVLNGTISIDFNVSDADANALTAGIYYADTNIGTTNAIITGLDLNSTANCPSFVVSSTEFKCSYSWNTTTAT